MKLVRTKYAKNTIIINYTTIIFNHRTRALDVVNNCHLILNFLTTGE